MDTCVSCSNSVMSLRHETGSTSGKPTGVNIAEPYEGKREDEHTLSLWNAGLSGLSVAVRQPDGQ